MEKKNKKKKFKTFIVNTKKQKEKKYILIGKGVYKNIRSNKTII